ncbi:alpha/beta hydrolase [Pseudomonas sp. OIL-1]|uniref:alpha/beta hydrolase n=1 Tax=Pseudomonas sp. OIL-1 TaxID=2706126 RepID=UPI0013A7AC93|nr:alpha/beta fold hydrolase [Pseudomonas sp. OIL-1]QIB52327.1 alpha/beta fold hydrolase [Pseudomonas sp. OIL-1]
MSAVEYQVCFVQGDWLIPAVWDKFERHFKACGFTCCVLSLPAPGELGWHRVLHCTDTRSSPLRRLVDFYAEQIAGLPVPPILIGHAMGGLVVQLLLDRGLGVAGVAIAPRPPRRVFPDTRSLLQILAARVEHLNGMRFLRMTSAQVSRCMGHPLSKTNGLRYERFVGRVPQTLMVTAAIGVGSRLRFNRERAPLLLVAGGDDRIVASSVVLANYIYQRRSLATTDYLLFPGYGHLIITQPGWEQVADRILEWLERQLGWF